MASGLINTINLMKLLIIHATQVVTSLRCRAIIQIHQCAAAKAWFHNQKVTGAGNQANSTRFLPPCLPGKGPYQPFPAVNRWCQAPPQAGYPRLTVNLISLLEKGHALHLLPDPFRQQRAAFRTGTREQNHELLTAISKKKITVTNGFLNTLGDRAQRLVTVQMPIVVVYPFKVINIQQHYGQ